MGGSIPFLSMIGINFLSRKDGLKINLDEVKMYYHVIPKSYYIKLVIKVIAIVSIGAFLYSIFLYYLTWKMLSTKNLKAIDEMSNHIFFLSLIVFFIFSVFIILGVVALTIFHSHKVAGPLYRMKMALRQITSGQLDFRVSFRKNDVVHPMASSLNHMIDQYNEKLNFIESRLLALRKSSVLLLEGQEDEKQEVMLMKKYLQEISKTYKSIKI